MFRKLFPPLFTLLLILSLVPAASPIRAAGADTSPTDLTSCSDWPAAPEIDSECAILMEAQTGAILYAKNMDEICYPASITKILTGLVTLENCSLDETVTFSYRATHELEEGSTSIARTEGEEMSVEDCLYALLLASANEVAQGLAEHVGGSIEGFVDMMNERAQELGCENSHFANPSGLNDENHYTTCRDMAIIMRAAIQNEDFLTIDSTQTYTIPPTNKHEEETIVSVKHKLLQNNAGHYEGAVAGKTGYTTIALNTLVTYAVRNNMELICVVMKSQNSHYDDTIALLDYGFDNFTMLQLSRNAVIDREASAELAQAEIPEDEWMVLPNSMDFAGLTSTLELTDEGEVDENGARTVGTIHYSYDGTELGSALLTVSDSSIGNGNGNGDGEEETSSSAGEEVTEGSAEENVPSSGLRSRIRQWLQALPFASSLQSLREEHAWVLGTIVVLLILLIVLIILLIFSLRGGSRRRPGRQHAGKAKPSSGRRPSTYGYIAPSHSGRHRKKNKYKMKRRR